jgi:2-phospho-L-lactate/phosphoenolpyruvate guanylyltransferase
VLPTAIVPLRAGPTAKRRLAGLLGPDERRELMRALLDHVLTVLDAAGLRVVVLSADPVELSADPIGPLVGAEVWPDRASGLNASLDDAIDRTSTPVLIVHADLPAVQASDIRALLDEPGDVVIARSRDGGTNALLMRERIRCAFGPSSSLAHASRARASGLRARVIDRPGLALDVDDEASLNASSSWPSVASLRSSTSRRPGP